MEALTSIELSKFLLAIGIMLILARLLSKIGHHFNVPTLVTEILAGIILGPTLLGIFFPEVHHFFFPTEGNLPDAYDTLFNISVVMLLFLAGMDLDFRLLTQKTKAIAITSIFAIFVPLLAGIWFAWRFFDFLHGIELSAAPYVFPILFGTIIAISSLPIIVRILMGHNILNTPIGITILGVSLITDLVGWFFYSSILVYVNAAQSNMQILYTLLYIITFFAVMFFISGQKKIMNKVFSQKEGPRANVSYDLAMLLGICLLTASFTNAIHIHSSLGAFIAGIMCRRIMGENLELLKQLEVFILNFFAPIFFISIGLKLNFAANFNLLIVLAVFAFACFSKLIGSYIGARLAGIPNRQSGAIAFGLNSRGSMEIIMGALALKMQLIGSSLFVAVVLVAVITSFIAEFGMIKMLKLNNGTKLAHFK